MSVVHGSRATRRRQQLRLNKYLWALKAITRAGGGVLTRSPFDPGNPRSPRSPFEPIPGFPIRRERKQFSSQ